MVTLSKKKIQEIIDGDGNIIGNEDTPQNGGNKETEAGHTTDYNARVHGQNFKNDFLGRFGFYFYESEGAETPPVVEDISAIVGEKQAHKVMEAIKPHIEKTLEESSNMVTEAKVVEDKLNDKRTDHTIVKKDNPKLNKKMEKVADLLAKLPISDLDSLMTLLEAKKKK